MTDFLAALGAKMALMLLEALLLQLLRQLFSGLFTAPRPMQLSLAS